MNLLTRLQTIILTSLLLGLLFSLAILPAPASAQQNNNQSVSCTVSFDLGKEEQKQEMNGDITMSLFFGGTKLNDHKKIMSNSEFKKKDSATYYVSDVLIKGTQNKQDNELRQSINFKLQICDNPYQGIGGFLNRQFKMNGTICVDMPVASPACTKNNDASTSRILKDVEDYNAFVETHDEKKCTVSFKNLPERLQSSGIPDNLSEIAYVKSQETGKNILTRMYKQDRSIVVDVEKEGNYLINAPSRADKWIGPVTADCPSKSTTPSPATILQKGEAGGDISGEEKSKPSSNRNNDTAGIDEGTAVSDTKKQSFILKLGIITDLDDSKRNVQLSWEDVPETLEYTVYQKTAKGREYYQAALLRAGSLSETVGVNKFIDYYFKVQACNSSGCIDSNEIFLPKKSSFPTVPPVADPTPTISPTSAPPAASSPSPSPTPTPTSAPQPPAGNSGANTQDQTNICKNSPRVADFNNDGKVDIADFNKMRDCLYPVNQILTEQEFLEWLNSQWKPEFLKSLSL